MAELRVELEGPLPASLPAGTGAAIFLFGTCFHPSAEVVGWNSSSTGPRSR